MGMSASQARFLQLTARQSNVEYSAQQISFERLRLSQTLAQASETYNDAMNNRKMVYTFNDGEGRQQVDVTYGNYKEYINQQRSLMGNANNQLFLVSSSGNKLIVGSAEDAQKMIDQSIGTLREFTADDFMIVEDLDDNDMFQRSIKDGTFYFATLEKLPENDEVVFKTESWESISGGAMTEVLDVSDDAAAEAKYKKDQANIENKDKKLELELNELESERNALHTEIESVQKVLEDNIEGSFKIFS